MGFIILRTIIPSMTQTQHVIRPMHFAISHFITAAAMAVHILGNLFGLWGTQHITWWAAFGLLVITSILSMYDYIVYEREGDE